MKTRGDSPSSPSVRRIRSGRAIVESAPTRTPSTPRSREKGLRSKSAKPYRTQWYCPNYAIKVGGRSDKNLDWTRNRKLSKKVKADINGDGYLSTLGTYNNWGNIVYGGGTVGSGPAVMSSDSMKVMKELTLEEHEEHQHR